MVGSEIAEAIQLLSALEAARHAGEDLLAELTDEFGSGLAALINLFNPDRIMLQGWVCLALGTVVLAGRESQPSSAKPLRACSRILPPGVTAEAGYGGSPPPASRVTR